MKPFKIIITGGRDYSSVAAVEAVLLLFRPTVVVHGDCKTGADAIAKKLCGEYGIEQIPVEAEWTKYGRSAGPRRNQKMIEEHWETSNCLVAFPGGNGTEDCVRNAKGKNMLVLRVDHE